MKWFLALLVLILFSFGCIQEKDNWLFIDFVSPFVGDLEIDGNLLVDGNLTVDGNLLIHGTTITLQDLNITDDANANRFCVPDGNCWDSGKIITQLIADANYIRSDGTSTTIAVISFAQGINVPGGEAITLGDIGGTDGVLTWVTGTSTLNIDISESTVAEFTNSLITITPELKVGGQTTLVHAPTGITSSTSTLVINPPSASANATPLWVGVDDTPVFRVDEDGDVLTGSVETQGRIIVGSTLDVMDEATFNSQVGIGTAPSAYPLDIVGGSAGSGLLQLRLGNNDTNGTSKVGGFSIRHHDNAEQDIAGLFALSLGTDNIFGWGGGDSLLNAATIHRFYAAENDRTLFGTLVLELDVTTADFQSTNIVTDGNIDLSGILKFLDGSGNFVGLKAPNNGNSTIWALPDSDGLEGDVISTDGLGNLKWNSNASEKTWAFMSRDASSGTNYVGGFYNFGSSDNDFNPSITHGTANSSYAAHFFIVCAAGGGGGTDTVIRVTGTSIDDQANRTTSDTQDLTADDAGAAGAYYETEKKWLGQVTISVQSGPDLLCNYGFTKYWDNNNKEFTVKGIEATWLGAKNDATPNIKLRHHKSSGWTYNNGSVPTPPTEIASMVTDHVTEIEIIVAEEGAWKRDNLDVDVNGDNGEGTIIELVTTTNRTYAIGNFIIRIVPT